MYLHRLIEPTIKKASATFPVTVICGPRQSGKTTLLHNIFPGQEVTFISLDDPNYRRLIMEDPANYLNELPKPVVIDEIQYLPEITTYIKILIDKNRTPGQWYITGSQQFSAMNNVSESLAGRAAILSLPTFQLKERNDIKGISDFILSGNYPELVVNKNIDTKIWYLSYLQTYIERDVRMILNVSNLRDFEQFIRLLAARTSQILNYSSLAGELGISVPTVKRWISILEASYIIFLLPPYFKNFGKRITKSPKLYFYDIGLVNYLVGIQNLEFLLNGPMSGAIFETAVISEIIKKKYAVGIKPELYFWRSQSGIEIDLIVPENGKVVPYEIKLARNIKPRFYKNIKYWLKLSNQAKQNGYLITNCSENVPLPHNIKNFYWCEL